MTAISDMDPRSSEPREREPALRDTRIEIRDDRVRQQLMAKLAEYRNRWHPEDGATAQERYQRGGRDALPLIFKETILDTVLTLDGDTERDQAANPIVITEVALAVQEATDLPVVGAATVPFVFNKDALTFAPDPRRLWDINPTQGSFLNAYMVIKTYATGSSFSVEGGTAIPELPLKPIGREIRWD